MAGVSVTDAVWQSRRKTLGLLFPTLGMNTASAQPMRRSGKTSTSARLSQAAASTTSLPTPPASQFWLDRASFGCTQSDLNAFNTLGADDNTRWSAWLAQQLDPASIDDSVCDARVASANFQTLGRAPGELWSNYHSITDNYNQRMLPIAEAECMTLIRQMYSQRQLFEVMIDFWHDHFSVFGWDYDGGPMFPAFDAIFRDVTSGNGIFGNFESLLIQVAESASMMYMLDLYSSTAGGPNENYARELCELHTLGAMNYAGVVGPDPDTGTYNLPTGTAADGSPIRLDYVDDDVYQVTSALSGWTISQSTWQTQSDPNAGEFEYVDSLHYKYQLYFLNRYIASNLHQQGGFDVFHWLAVHPGVAKHIATKLCTRLVSDSPSSSLIDNVTNVFFQNYQAPNQLQLVTEAILSSAEYLETWGEKMKRPARATVDALRKIGADFTPIPDPDNPNPDYRSNTWTTTDSVIYGLQAAGHRLFYWPAPNGYPDSREAWSSTGALGMTLRLLPQLVETTSVLPYSNNPYLADIQGQTMSALADADRTAANIAGLWCDRILGYRPANVYDTAVDLMRQNAQPGDVLDLTTDSWNTNNLSQHYTQSRLRSMVSLILCSPDFLTL